MISVRPVGHGQAVMMGPPIEEVERQSGSDEGQDSDNSPDNDPSGGPVPISRRVNI